MDTNQDFGTFLAELRGDIIRNAETQDYRESDVEDSKTKQMSRHEIITINNELIVGCV